MSAEQVQLCSFLEVGASQQEPGMPPPLVLSKDADGETMLVDGMQLASTDGACPVSQIKDTTQSKASMVSLLHPDPNRVAHEADTMD